MNVNGVTEKVADSRNVGFAVEPDILDVQPKELRKGGLIDINEENSCDKKKMSLKK